MGMTSAMGPQPRRLAMAGEPRSFSKSVSRGSVACKRWAWTAPPRVALSKPVHARGGPAPGGTNAALWGLGVEAGHAPMKP